MEFEKAWDLFADNVRRLARLTSALGLLDWDMQTVMPHKGGAARAQVLGVVSAQAFALATAREYGEAMRALQQMPEKLDIQQVRMLELAWREYSRFEKIPAKDYEAYTILQSEATQSWRRAKADNDFAAFEPYLQKLIDYNTQFAQLWGYEDTPYDALLAGYDPQLLTAQIDPLFADLLAGTRRLMEKLPRSEAPAQPVVEPQRQKALGEYLLREIGYDLEAGNLMETEHPFTSGIHSGDVRVTTKYIPEMPFSSIFSVIHEGGHGIYEQNIDSALDGTNLFGGTSMGIHESQSRFYENVIGRGRGFWATRFEEASRLAGVQLGADVNAFWRSINHIQPSLVRIEADELTYNLHIIIRYELEREIFAGGIRAKEMPEIWNGKYEKYLGVRPDSDTNGILQDTHWGAGMFGYFPSYAIGNLCAAQLAAAMQAELGELDKLAQTSAGMSAIKAWMTQHVYKFGSLRTPAQIMEQATRKPLGAQDFLAYMEDKLAQLA